MRIIEMDSTQWKTPLDFCRALLITVGAPEWNGTSIQAMLDSLVWDGLNTEKPPYTIRIKHTAGLSRDILDEIELLNRCLSEARAESLTSRGYDVDVNLEVVP